MKHSHPYQGLDSSHYWRSSTSAWKQNDFSKLYSPKFQIDQETKIATAGSCFAQHITRNLKARGYNFLDLEPPPRPLPAGVHADFGYNLYSARYGNIYSSRQLFQLVQETFGRRVMDEVWEEDGRCFDPLRPSIEPNGFSSAEEMRALRNSHLFAVRKMIQNADVFIFTLGLTEVWVNRVTGTCYQSCPGTVAGRFDPDTYEFVNLTYLDVYKDMEKLVTWWRKINPTIRFILTVSPVPLAATASRQHIVQATTYSKSVLRAVAGDLKQQYDFIDYFPSYEMITSNLNPTTPYLPNMREVSDGAVGRVMSCFFAAHGGATEPGLSSARADETAGEFDAAQGALAHAMPVVCDEAVLDMGSER